MSRSRSLTFTLIVCLLPTTGLMPTPAWCAETLELTLRNRDTNNNEVKQRQVRWEPEKTAIVICDMWDGHWCRGAANRVGEMAIPMNRLISDLRDRGVLVIHAPSSVVSHYDGRPAREYAKRAPFAQPPVQLSTADRWGTKWCWPDPQRETDLPIDDSDMGCDCQEKCTIREAWTRQIDTIEIVDGDVITDNGQEFFNVLAEKGIDNIMIMGVHLNMCVLGRPFGIRQSTRLGKQVALIRDMTDTMYNSKMRPYVSHFAGNELVVEHVEKYWCPTLTSNQIVGGKPFKFREDAER